MPPTVLLLRSASLHWRGLHAALAECSGMEVIGDVRESVAALQLAEKERPALIIVPDRVNDQPVASLVYELHVVSPNSRYIVIGEKKWLDSDVLLGLAPLESVAYVLWDDLTEEAVMPCLHLLLKSNLIVTSPAVAAAFIEMQRTPTNTASCLSKREQEVFRLAGSGMTFEKIATTLYITTSTVKTHAAHIRQKLELPHHEDIGAAYRRLTSTGTLFDTRSPILLRG